MIIGFFDSGLGGLSVLKELISEYPNNEYIYFGDTINLPYGNKSKKQLLTFVDKIIKFFKDEEVDLIIVACGTSSSNIYFDIKDKYHVPIIDILSPTINYLLSCNNKKIGVMGTEMLIKSKYFDKYLKNKEVVSVKAPKLVPLIEKGEINSLEMQTTLKEYLKVFDENMILVLGCTHYPLLAEKILKIKKLKLIDMGKVLSKHINLTNKGQFKIKLYFSKVDATLLKNVKQIFNDCKLYEKKL